MNIVSFIFVLNDGGFRAVMVVDGTRPRIYKGEEAL